MTIGEVASRLGLRASAIRYYEGAGLLPEPPRVGGRRVYGESVLDRMAFIQYAREAGFTIAEIKLLSNASTAAKPLSAKMRQLAARKIEEVDRLVERANLMKGMLTRSLRCQCIDTEECGRRIRRRRNSGE
jgi:MerR family transcriptional regulator, redox-sensitive transcriptional activator SoxR